MESVAVRLKAGLRHSRIKGVLRRTHQAYRRMRVNAYIARHPKTEIFSDYVRDPLALVTELEVRGYTVRKMNIVPAEYDAFLSAAAVPEAVYAGMYRSKLLEHYLSITEFHNLDASKVAIDLACHGSPFADVIRKFYGSTVYRQDLLFPPGIQGDRMGGDAAAMPLPDGSVDAMTLHNSLEHFEGDSDIRMIRETARVLRPGGRLCIVPLDLVDHYLIRTDPTLRRPGLRFDHDPDARIVEFPGLGQRHERFYNVDALEQRVLKVSSLLKPYITYVENAHIVGGFRRPIFMLTLEHV